MIVYHGSNVVVQNPNIKYSERNLDFGKGFYVTTVKEQAERWAKRKAILSKTSIAIVNEYELKDFSNFIIITFDEIMTEWLDFVCSCRDGNDFYKNYDIIMGKVADDKVFRVVDMYKRGIWDKERALKEIKVYETFDQIAIISQKVIDEILCFKNSYKAEI